MSVHFRTLALQIGSCPLTNIRVDIWPDETCLIPGCERECNESKMALRNLKGTYGQGIPITSPSNVTSVVVAGTGLSDKEELPCVNSCS